MSSGTVSAIRPSAEPRPAVLAVTAFTAFLAAGGLGETAVWDPEERALLPAEEREGRLQTILVEAAQRNRARVAASRRERGPAPLFTDTDLAGFHRPDRSRGPSPDPFGAAVLPSRDLWPPEEGAGWEADTGEDDSGRGEVDLEDEVGEEEADSTFDPEPPAAGPTEQAERAAELRERLLDIEASLAAIGASGLPVAPRHPNRFESALDAARLRTEREEIGRELDALTRRKPLPDG